MLLQKTGPNGIHACFHYDDLGREISETAHCGSGGPLTTTTTYALTGVPIFSPSGIFLDVEPAAGLPATSATVTVNRPPNGATTWSFADDQGKNCAKQSYAFDGGFVGTRTTYNALGMVLQVSKPFHVANFTDTPTMSLTTTTYDAILLNRVDSISEDLGVIDGSGSPAAAVSAMIYDGSKVVTTRIVNGQSEMRTEIKNVMGKVEQVADAYGSPMTFTYDADGNVVVTSDSSGNVVSSTYDSRDRKIAMTDPDMGAWSYTFNGFGDLVEQIDPAARARNSATSGTTINYDNLGRMISRTDDSGTAQWVYDVAPGAGIGKLAAMIGSPDPNLMGSCTIPFVTDTDGNRAGKSFAYTSFGDVLSTSECV